MAPNDSNTVSMREVEARLDGLKELITSLRAYIDAQTRAGEMALNAFKEHVEERFEADQKALAAALLSADRAVSKNEASTDRRLEGMNEFRAALSDYSRTLIPRPEFEAIHREIKEKIEALTTRLAARELMPRAESEKMHLDTKEKLADVFSRLSAIDARRSGRSDLWGWIVGAVGLVIAVVTVMNKLFGGG